MEYLPIHSAHRHDSKTTRLLIHFCYNTRVTFHFTRDQFTPSIALAGLNQDCFSREGDRRTETSPRGHRPHRVSTTAPATAQLLNSRLNGRFVCPILKTFSPSSRMTYRAYTRRRLGLGLDRARNEERRRGRRRRTGRYGRRRCARRKNEPGGRFEPSRRVSWRRTPKIRGNGGGRQRTPCLRAVTVGANTDNDAWARLMQRTITMGAQH